jgi:hypothetical protein
VSERQGSVRPRRYDSSAGKFAWRILLGVLELGLVVGLFFAVRFAVSSLRSPRSGGSALEGSFIFAPAQSRTFPVSNRISASFDGHSYICAEDPERPGRYAVVFRAPLQGGDDLVYAGIRHAVLTAYGQDLSGVIPEVSSQGEAQRLEFRLEGIAYVALTAPDALRGELAAFTLHREE